MDDTTTNNTTDNMLPVTLSRVYISNLAHGDLLNLNEALKLSQLATYGPLLYALADAVTTEAARRAAGDLIEPTAFRFPGSMTLADIHRGWRMLSVYQRVFTSTACVRLWHNLHDAMAGMLNTHL